MDDYENYYNEAIKEIRRLRIVVREYQEDINLLNAWNNLISPLLPVSEIKI